MNQRGVWKKITRSQIPSDRTDRRCLKCKWIFKIKKNDSFLSKISDLWI